MNLAKKAIAIGLVCVMGATMLCGCTPSDNKTVATIGDDKLTYGVANLYARYTEQLYETYYSYYSSSTDDVWSQEANDGSGDTVEDTTKDTVIDTLKDMYILEDHMDDYDVSLTDDEKATIKKTAKKIVKANSKEAREKLSITQANCERLLTLMTIQDKMYDAIIKDADTDISDDEVAQKKMHYVEFEFASNMTTVDSTEEAVNAMKESTTSDDEDKDDKDTAKSKAEDLESSLKSQGVTTDNIEELVEAAGYDANVKTFDSEDTEPSEDVIAAADKLAAGEFTIVEGDDRYYLVYLDSTFDEDATTTAKNELISERQGDVYNEVIEKWEDKTEFKLKKSVWNKISFNDLGVVSSSSDSE